MDLNHPGTDLFRDSDASALLVLARRPFGTTGREVARLSGKGSHSSVLRALKRLSDIGLVRNRSVGPATLYTLNRDHIYWPAIFEIMASPAKIEQRIGEIVESYKNKNVTAALFGSFARQEADDASDLDLIIVVPDDFPSAVRESLIDRLTDELSSFTGNRIQVVDVSRAAVHKMSTKRDPLIASWLRDSRTLFGPELNQVIEDAQS